MNDKKHDLQKEPTVLELVMSYFKIGLTAYGVAILQQIKALIIGKKWLSRQEVDQGIAMVQLYPGPIMYNLAIYCAYKIKGFWGSLLGALFFILPSYFLMVFLSWIYFTYSTVSWVKPLLFAIDAMVVGIVLHITLDFGKRYVNDFKSALIAGTAFILMLFKVNALWIVLMAVVVKLFIDILDKGTKNKPEDEKETAVEREIPGKLKNRLVLIILSGVIFLLILIIGIFVKTTGAQLMTSMAKIGAVAFGSGFTILPLLQQEAVISHHWVNMQQFADGIAFGQITPGPILITSTFIGYKVAGFWGSAIATFGMFFPSFFYTLVVTEIYEKIKRNRIIRRAILGVMSGFTGMLVWVFLSLAKVSLHSLPLYIWAVGSFILVRYLKMNILWIFLLGIAARFLLFYAGVF